MKPDRLDIDICNVTYFIVQRIRMGLPVNAHHKCNKIIIMVVVVVVVVIVEDGG